MAHFEPSLEQFIGYLAHLGERNSTNVVYNHLSAINYYHRLELLSSPSHNEHVTMFMKGLKRLERERNPQRVTRARPLTPEILSKVRVYLENNQSLRNIRTVWRIFVCYYCMLRWDDISKLRTTDIEYDNNDETYRLRIRGGKTSKIKIPRNNQSSY